MVVTPFGMVTLVSRRLPWKAISVIVVTEAGMVNAPARLAGATAMRLVWALS